MRNRKLYALPIALIALLLGAACSKSTPSGTSSTPPSTPPVTSSSPAPASSSPAAAAASVKATDALAFVPGSVTIKAGQTVTWSNDGTVPHTVTFDDGPAFSQQLGTGATVTRTFATAGTFKYHCAIHGPSMNGTVVVTA